MSSILVIDDYEPVREHIAFILKKEGHKVITAVHGEEGLDIFKMIKPDLVLTDVAMPYKDGIELLIDIKGMDPSARVIVISGTEQREMLLDIAGIFSADAMITKPFTSKAILAAVDQVLSAETQPLNAN